MQNNITLREMPSPIDFGVENTKKKKQYRNIARIANAIRAKYSIKVNQELYNDMVKKDNQNNPTWD